MVTEWNHFVLLVVALIQISCTDHEADHAVGIEADVAAIQDSLHDIVVASEDGNADAYVDRTTKSVVWYGTGTSAVSGKANVREFLSQFFDRITFSFPDWTTDAIVVAGDTAIHRYWRVLLCSDCPLPGILVNQK